MQQREQLHSPNDIILKHFIDSALPYAEIKAKARIIDVGSGAGFPGIPLKILRDDITKFVEFNFNHIFHVF